ncbi:hypothetical protein TSTA_014430 [Talaromyces stipitatus ATCC 10500]|uniref:Tachykinin family protein n=1 Tax=Talaromyces stipitatus (strain ATCC 10500 / CBS 375.48 / QM 6759 / NRRL 1006) TaxID=441959 RepID=B8MGX1_TALSN|nr:uncharacterized protein TSTA_014430 [Talaromyces stipitatus ATCC 10500]EED16352.1 hypothetical protein TSTA_014430 [Talaromyces stipitatus ATCC 10500]
MDAKTGSVASDDTHRAAHSRQHSYEQVFTTFATPQQPQFVQSISPTQDDPSNKEDNGDDKSPTMSQQPKTGGSRSPLFWVNSDPQTVRKGSREETLKRIRSHVMSEHNRKKRLENTRRYNKSKTWKNLAYRPEPIATSRLSRAIESSISPPYSSSSSSDRSSSKSSSSPEIREQSPPDSLKKSRSAGSLTSETSIAFSTIQDFSQESTSSTQSSPQEQQLSLVRHEASVPVAPRVGTDELDPFHATQVQLSESQYQHFKFFLYDLIPQAAPFMNHGIAKLRNHWVSLAQSNPSVLYCCITSGVTNKSLRTGDFFADPATRRDSPLVLDRLRNRGLTISLINRDLSSASSAASDASIAAVSMLISVEITGSNPQDIAPHLNGLRKMVSLRKNFADISKNVRVQVEWNDIRSACKTMSKPLFPFIRYAMPAHTPPQVRVENAGKLASTLRLLSRIPGVFGVEMCRTIDDLTSVTLYAEIFRLQPKLASVLFDEDIEEYFNNEALYTEYCLVNDRWIRASSTANSTFTLRGDDTIEGAVRLASLLFHNTTIWPFYPAIAPLFPLPVIALETALRHGIAAGTYTYLPDLLIWLLFIGASAAKYLPTSRIWFMDELCKAIDTYNTTIPLTTSISPGRGGGDGGNNYNEYESTQFMSTVDDFRDVLMGFFFVDRCYGADVSEIWRSLTGR